MVFTIKAKDGMGRIGTLSCAHGKVETPTLMPVLNPRHLKIKPDEMVKLGVEIFITNAYLIYRDQETRQKALEMGLHDYLGYKGPLMTDSGAFQLMMYGNIEIDNDTITTFQEEINTDIGVFLDIPVKKGKRKEYERALKITLERAREHLVHRRETNLLWTGPIQGGPHPDLVERAALEMTQMNFQLHALGSVVPLMEQYKYTDVLKMIIAAKRHLPTNRPFHLFGAGHPMFFAITAYLGCDLYDSAAYVLFAKRNDYMTATGTRSLSEISYFPCSCQVCQSLTPDELKKEPIPEKERLLALHNITASMEEIKRVKQAIKEGRLLNLALERSKTHPELAKAFRSVLGTSTHVPLIEKHDSITKRKALFISDPLLYNNALIYRFQQRLLDNFYAWADNLVIHHGKKPHSSLQNTQFVSIHPVLGPLPEELFGVFPSLQFLSIELQATLYSDIITAFIEKHAASFQKVFDFTKDPSESFNTFLDGETNQKNKFKRDKNVIKARIDFQFGKSASKGLKGMSLKLARTGVPRGIILNGEEVASIRASDQLVMPNMKLARILKDNLEPPRVRITVNPEVKEFILEGKSIFAKHVLEADPNLRKGEQALIVTTTDELLAVGECLLSGWEMKGFNTGLAAKNKKH
ncbi:MAG: tRNA guanosine(15) transglycosylase TgtA [Candidatus Hodarchaeales archaeon]|jgi:7-cyano-7-deazaguanine tRNA-ribosyltransferase